MRSRRRRPSPSLRYACGGLAQTLLGDAVDDRRLDGLDLLPRDVRAEAERIRTGGKRAHRSFLESDGSADRAHLQRVGDDEAFKAELGTDRKSTRLNSSH